jgi:hypothetical protein
MVVTQVWKGERAKMSELRAPKLYTIDEDEAVAIMDLMAHLHGFNAKFGVKWSLVQQKRGRLGAVIGKASDANHLLYQSHVDLVLEKCARPVTVDKIIQILTDAKEKPSTAKLLAPSYMKYISYILDPSTKMHRKATRTLAEWGTP